MAQIPVRDLSADAKAIKKPRTWRGVIGVRLFCREIDSDYSTPPAFPFRVLYSSQPRVMASGFPTRS